MAFFNLNPALLNVPSISSQQTNPINDGSSWFFVPEFAEWIDNNQPFNWLAFGSTGLWLEIDDARIAVINDYLENWATWTPSVIV